MKKIKTIAVLTGLFTMLQFSAGAQPPPPNGSGGTTSVPLDPASVVLLAGAALLKLKAKQDEPPVTD